METYSNVAETQLKIKKFLKEHAKLEKEENETAKSITNVQINTGSFEGTLTDLLTSI